MGFVVRGIETACVDAIRNGGNDANGQAAIAQPVRDVANPCRHCLGLIAEGEQKLVLAYRPFARLQPAIIRGYGHEDWILYEIGSAVPGEELSAVCEEIVSNPHVSYVHIRSKYNCFQCRVDRT